MSDVTLRLEEVVHHTRSTAALLAEIRAAA
jgi:hypothetical protein